MWNKCIVLCQIDGYNQEYCEKKCCKEECQVERSKDYCQTCVFECYGGLTTPSVQTCHYHDCRAVCDGVPLATHYWYVCDNYCNTCVENCKKWNPSQTVEQCKRGQCAIPCRCSNRVEAIDQICTKRMGSCMAAGGPLEYCQNEHYYALLGCEERLPGLYDQVCDRCMFFCMSDGHSYESCETKHCSHKFCKGRLSIPCGRCSNSTTRSVDLRQCDDCIKSCTSLGQTRDKCKNKHCQHVC